MDEIEFIRKLSATAGNDAPAASIPPMDVSQRVMRAIGQAERPDRSMWWVALFGSIAAAAVLMLAVHVVTADQDPMGDLLAPVSIPMQ